MTAIKLNTLIVSGFTVSESTIEDLKKEFKEVHYFPDPEVLPPKDLWKEVEVWYIRFTGLPEEISSVEQVPRLRLLQLTSGASRLLPFAQTLV